MKTDRWSDCPPEIKMLRDITARDNERLDPVLMSVAVSEFREELRSWGVETVTDDLLYVLWRYEVFCASVDNAALPETSARLSAVPRAARLRVLLAVEGC